MLVWKRNFSRTRVKQLLFAPFFGNKILQTFGNFKHKSTLVEVKFEISMDIWKKF